MLAVNCLKNKIIKNDARMSGISPLWITRRKHIKKALLQPSIETNEGENPMDVTWRGDPNLVARFPIILIFIVVGQTHWHTQRYVNQPKMLKLITPCSPEVPKSSSELQPYKQS